jgi:pyrroline-5-carboxylate reductase
MFRLVTSAASRTTASSSSTLVGKAVFTQYSSRNALLSSRWFSGAASAAATTTTTTITGPLFDKIAFIGTGKMAHAMISPLITNGYQPESQVSVYDVSTKAMKNIQKDFPNIQTTQSIGEAVSDADFIVLAVKPQNINESFWQQFPKKGNDDDDAEAGKYNLRDDATLLSICAGIPLRNFEPSGVQKIVRSMPNTPSTIGQGMTVWCCTPNLVSKERESVSNLLHTFGKAIYVDDEKFVDMSTSISGSGPAYIFMLMEAMIDAVSFVILEYEFMFGRIILIFMLCRHPFYHRVCTWVSLEKQLPLLSTIHY